MVIVICPARPEVMKMVYRSVLPASTQINHYGTMECQFQRKMTRKAILPQIGYMEFENATHSYMPFPLIPSSSSPR